MDLYQTAPIGAVCSGSTLFASILNSSVMLCNYLQQTTSADDIFRCIFFLGALRVKTGFLALRPILCCYRCDSQFNSCRHNNRHTHARTHTHIPTEKDIDKQSFSYLSVLLFIHHICIYCWFPLYRWSVMGKQVTSTPPIPGNGGGSGYLYLHY